MYRELIDYLRNEECFIEAEARPSRMRNFINDYNASYGENLSIDDLDTYSQISKRIKKEDVFSIVTTSFMPYGIESDQYSILAEIKEVEEMTNPLTEEKIYVMEVECNSLQFRVVINQKDLLGEPAVGRRFKGSIWMQGAVCL